MTDRQVKRVWILGSGFSRPLGGPLLADLLSPRFEARVGAAFPALAKSEAVSRLYWFFREAKKQSLFEHAEDFFVQLADPDATAIGALEGQYARFCDDVFRDHDRRVPLDSLRNLAKRVIAAECSMHVPPRIGNDERFLSYQEWAERLTGNDSIITFNYDLLVERLRPGPALDVFGLDPPRDRSTPRLHKMHGSLDWYSDEAEDEITRVSRKTSTADVPIIGVPGATKYSLSQTPLFQRIWASAGEALQNAEEVYVVGYSMPESDQFAVRFICDALRENGPMDLDIELVLGPPSFTTERLQEVFALSLAHRTNLDRMSREWLATRNLSMTRPSPGFRVKVRRAYAQDFLAAWRPS